MIKPHITYEYLDSEVLVAEEEEAFVASLLDTHASDVPDLILTCGDQATYSLLIIDHPLAHQVPVVFSGVNYLNPKLLKRYTNVTGFTTEQLPLGAEIINMPFYERYKFRLILFGELFVLLVAGLTVQLLRLYRREREAKKKARLHLQDHKNKLDITMKSIREGVIPNRRFLYI